MKKYSLLTILSSLLLSIYLFAIYAQAISSLVQVKYIKGLDGVKNIKQEELTMALESIKGANEAISINVMLVFFFQAIIVVLAVLDFINKRKATSEGSKGE